MKLACWLISAAVWIKRLPALPPALPACTVCMLCFSSCNAQAVLYFCNWYIKSRFQFVVLNRNCLSNQYLLLIKMLPCNSFSIFPQTASRCKMPASFVLWFDVKPFSCRHISLYKWKLSTKLLTAGQGEKTCFKNGEERRQLSRPSLLNEQAAIPNPHLETN